MNLEKEIREIHKRNRKVEADKAWEISWARRVFISVLTYAVALVWLFVIENNKPFLNAFVPTLGYILSTLSLPFIKSWWINKSRENENS